MHKDQKAFFRSAIKRMTEINQKADAMRDMIAETTRQLVLIQADASSARTDLLKLYAELNGKEEL